MGTWGWHSSIFASERFVRPVAHGFPSVTHWWASWSRPQVWVFFRFQIFSTSIQIYIHEALSLLGELLGISMHYHFTLSRVKTFTLCTHSYPSWFRINSNDFCLVPEPSWLKRQTISCQRVQMSVGRIEWMHSDDEWRGHLLWGVCGMEFQCKDRLVTHLSCHIDDWSSPVFYSSLQ